MLNTPAKLQATESDRISWLCCLSGLSRLEWNTKLKEMERQLQIERAKELCDRLPRTEVVGASKYLSQLDQAETMEDPLRFFAALANGQTYKGKFDELLHEIAPELLTDFECITVVDKKETLRRVLDECENRAELFRVLELELPPSAPQPPESGTATGKANEENLLTFLQSRTTDGAILMSNVLVKPPGRGRSKPSIETACIETSEGGANQTSEFDAMIIKVLDEETIQIIQVWEAKATIHPISIGDAILKKMPSLSAILQDEQARFCLDDKRYRMIGPALTLGIYGQSSLPPEIAARRLRRVEFQMRLSKDPEFGRCLLDSGGSTLFDSCTKLLDRLLVEAARYDLIVVIGGSVWS